MPHNKYSDYIITDFKPGLVLPEFRGAPGVPTARSHLMMWLGNKVIKGSPYVEAVWLWPKAANPHAGFPQHVHDHDETIGFFGSDTNNVYDLGGEIEFWLEDEKHILTKTCIIFIPRGLRHCPLVIKRVDRPIFEFTSGPGSMFSIASENSLPMRAKLVIASGAWSPASNRPAASRSLPPASLRPMSS